MQIEKEVTTADDIFVDEWLSSGSSDVGDFVYPSANELIFGSCNLEFYVFLRLRRNMPKVGKKDIVYFYEPHFSLNGTMQGGKVSTSDNSEQVYDAILSHEKAHASSFLDKVVPAFRKYIQKYKKCIRNVFSIYSKCAILVL